MDCENKKANRKKKKKVKKKIRNRKSAQKVLAAPSTPNKIFTPNDDCLVEIFNNLSLKDVFNVMQADVRFRSAALIRFSHGSVAVINKRFLKDFPNGMQGDFYKVYGPLFSKMKFKNLPEPKFFNAIGHFQNLHELILSEMSISGEGANDQELPRSLKSLELDQCRIPEKVLLQWFVQVSATLTELRIYHRSIYNGPEPPTYECFGELRNIRNLVIHGKGPKNSLGKLIAKNKEHLRSLELVSSSNTFAKPLQVPKHVWNRITNLPHLTELKLLNYIVGNVSPLPPNLWPQLRTLTLQIYGSHPIISHLGCQHSLNSLCIFNEDGTEIDWTPLVRFPNLRHLELHRCSWWLPTDPQFDLSAIGALQQVHYLVLNDGFFQSSRQLADMAANMKNLKKLILNDILFPKEHPLRWLNCVLETEVENALAERMPALEVQVSVRDFL